MIPNHSPWIKQLNRTRPAVALDTNIQSEVVIVGGGIAGITTAFFALRDTNQKVVLLESDLIAHGATGHNAGQITSYFERPLHELVDEYGVALAIDAQRSVESAWMLLEQIVQEAQLKTPFYRFMGHAGVSDMKQVISHLQNNRYRVDGGLRAEQIIIAKEWEQLKDIPAHFADLYSVAPHEDILELLETKSSEYIATISYEKGCMNSALFTEELVGYLISTYPERFSFYENSPVTHVSLQKNGGTLTVTEFTVSASRIILCTNGFEYFTITNETGTEIDTTFHHSIAGRIGYMSGYVEPLDHSPTAISYFPKVTTSKNDPTGESYFYLTRRPHEEKGCDSHNLVCIGGPDKVLPNGADYSRKETHSEEIQRSIADFVKNTYSKFPKNETNFSFSWHGLMGYTPNGIRRVGYEPRNPVLLYNLGCNGVGILPSIFGSHRIARLLNNEILEKSIFDPVN